MSGLYTVLITPALSLLPNSLFFVFSFCISLTDRPNRTSLHIDFFTKLTLAKFTQLLATWVIGLTALRLTQTEGKA
jgi:hypothetical protein